jgi:hypothetical protein
MGANDALALEANFTSGRDKRFPTIPKDLSVFEYYCAEQFLRSFDLSDTQINRRRVAQPLTSLAPPPSWGARPSRNLRRAGTKNVCRDARWRLGSPFAFFAPRSLLWTNEVDPTKTLSTSHHGKGTTSVVPTDALTATALAAEGQQSKRKPGNAEQNRYSAGSCTNPRLTGF